MEPVNDLKMGVNNPLFWSFFKREMGINDNLEEQLSTHARLVEDVNSRCQDVILVVYFSLCGEMRQ